ncbi:Xaa-Pro aminopeptidase [Malassezia psittaci]|uniref:Exocyst complex component Sec8 n=1 Tax=Malassezia psittaci TaxID=1821823 RepID=A0AAF0F764_9BASI|nr:Xaa-Pro aminopeptidase [Malassezia psittaci]
MLKRPAGSKRRPQIRHENEQLGRGAGVTEGPITVPGHNVFINGGSNAQATSTDTTLSRAPQGAEAHSNTSAAGHAANAPYMSHTNYDFYSSSAGPPSVAIHNSALQYADSTPAQASAYAGVQSMNHAEASPLPSPGPSGRPSIQSNVPSSNKSFVQASNVPDLQNQGRNLYANQDVPGLADFNQRTSVSSHSPSLDLQPGPSLAIPPVSTPSPQPPISSAEAYEPSSRDQMLPTQGDPGWAQSIVTNSHQDTRQSTEPPPPIPGVRSRLRRSADIPSGPSSAAFDAEHPTLNSLSQERQPVALDAVLKALSAAGRKQQTARILRRKIDTQDQSQAMELIRSQQSQDVSHYVAHTDQPKFRALNATLRKIQKEWGYMLDDHFSALALALALLPQGSLRGRLQDFGSLNSLIEQTLQGTLDDHYESFAMAITSNHGMLQHLGSAQELLTSTRSKLHHARDALGAKRADLVQMWQRVETLQEALRVLTLVEELRSVPDQLETLMSEKRFLQATQLLMRSMRMMQSEELAKIGALADLRQYFRSQENSLLDILIEEVHNHLYLKSFYCDSRWKSYVAQQDTLPDVVFGEDYGMDIDTHDSQRPTKLARFLHVLATRIYTGADPDITHDRDHDILTSEHHTGDPMSWSATFTAAKDRSPNPEQDSFLYLEMLLDSLARLGKIGYALEIVTQRLPFEVHQLVDTTIDEVDRRHDLTRYATSQSVNTESVLFAPSTLTASFLYDGRPRKSFSLASAAQLNVQPSTNQQENSALQRDMETMRDFFWTLFSKLDAMLQGHRVVQEVATSIMQRADAKDAASADRASMELGVPTLIKVWQAVEYELRALLHDYLSEDTLAVVEAASHSAPSLNELLRTHRYDRDRTRSLFRMADVRKQPAALRKTEDAVDAALRTFVPGLVHQENSRNNTTSDLLVSVNSSARPEEYTGAGHRLLVRPLTFTVSVLFQPTLAFIARAAHILPQDAAGANSRGFGGFLREFVQMMFLPMLEDKVQQLVSSTTSGPESFAVENVKRIDVQKPVVRSAAQMIALVDSLYTMLQAAPVNRASYSRLILVVLVEYYGRCNERFKVLVSEDLDLGARQATGPYVRAVVWAQRPELYKILREAVQVDRDSVRGKALRNAEAKLQRSYATEAPVHRADLMTSRKRLMALGHLHASVQWMYQHLKQFRAISESSSSADHGSDTDLPLPLNASLMSRFQEIPEMYLSLSQMILMTLRTELRLKALHYLQLAFTEGTYIVDSNALEPDVHVLDWNSDLTVLNEMLKDTLSLEHRQFVLDGLDVLLDGIMVDGVLQVRLINRHGVTKMIRNILSLQQNLKNLVTSPQLVDLERSRRFWEMLSRDPQQWIGSLRQSHPAHSFEQYKAALDLCIGLDRSAAEPGISHGQLVRMPFAGTLQKGSITLQQYNELLIELHSVIG